MLFLFSMDTLDHLKTKFRFDMGSGFPGTSPWIGRALYCSAVRATKTARFIRRFFMLYIHLFILHGYITNSQYDQLPVGLIAQLVEHCTGIAEVMGSNPVEA